MNNVQRAKNYASWRRAGYTSAEARRLRDIRRPEHVEYTQREIYQARPQAPRVGTKPRTRAGRKPQTTAQRVESRKRLWANYAQHDSYPAWIESLAGKLNNDAGLDPLDSYGWRVIFRRWVLNQELSNADLQYLQDNDT